MATITANTLDEALWQCRDMGAPMHERLACYAQAVHRVSPHFTAATLHSSAARVKLNVLWLCPIKPHDLGVVKAIPSRAG